MCGAAHRGLKVKPQGHVKEGGVGVGKSFLGSEEFSLERAARHIVSPSPRLMAGVPAKLNLSAR